MNTGIRVIAMVTVLAASACSGGDRQAAPEGATPSTTATTGPDLGRVEVCDLLTIDEVGRVVGGDVAAGISGTASCAWSSPGIPSVILAVIPVPEQASCLSLRPEGAASVMGVGAEAWWEFVLAEQPTGSLVACPHGVQLSVTVSGSEHERRLRGIGEELAARALERLKP